jgi:hypothetical protein
MSGTKAKFYWARIGDGNFEPVAVTGKKGERMAYTIGCPDPFPVDVADSAIVLSEDEYDRLSAPLTPKQEAAAQARERRYQALRNSHSYAGFGRSTPSRTQAAKARGA